jgi:hypothetical protein
MWILAHELSCSGVHESSAQVGEAGFGVGVLVAVAEMVGVFVSVKPDAS